MADNQHILVFDVSVDDAAGVEVQQREKERADESAQKSEAKEWVEMWL